MKAKNNNQKIKKLAMLGIFIAVIVVLQLVSAYIHIGPISITLVLLPIVIGGAIFGIEYGAILGAAFGIATFAFAVSGIDIGGNMMFAANPFLTFIVCVAKGTCAGAVSAAVYKLANKLTKGKNYISYLLASFAAPTVNTGIFLLFACTCYRTILQAWAGGSDILTYIFASLLLLNYLPELVFCLILSPIVGVRCQKTNLFDRFTK